MRSLRLITLPSLWCLIQATSVIPAWAESTLNTPSPEWAPGLFWQNPTDKPGTLQRGATLVESRYETDVTGLIAVTHLTQTFRNDSPDWQEAIYRFPLPEDAAVFALEIHNGEETIIGQIEEKQRAEARYIAAREDGIQAVLTEQDRPNLFSQRISAIGPGETVSLSLAFQHGVGYSDGAYALDLPTTFTPRYAPAGIAGPEQAFLPAMHTQADRPLLTITVTLNDTLPIDRIESQGFTSRVSASARGTQIRLTDEGHTSDHDFHLEWETAHYAEPGLIWAQEMVNDTHYLQLMLEPPVVEAAQETLNKSQIWVLDTSGSMEGESLRQAKAALKQGLAQLNPGDTFNVIEFNDAPQALFATPVPATPDWLDIAHKRIDRLQAAGGTEIPMALAEAFAQPESEGSLRQILFVTDGSVANEDAVLQQVALDRRNGRLFTIGIGSAPNRFLLRKAAELGQGSSLFIQSLDDVETQIKHLADRLNRPVLTDLSVYIDGQPGIPVRFPTLGRDVYAGEPLMLLARLPKQLSPDAHLILKATIASQTSSQGFAQAWERTLNVRQIPTHPGVARAWARQQIQLLEDLKTLGEDATTVRKGVVRLALEHRLVSPYTSLIAVADHPSRPSDAALRVSNVANALPRGWSHSDTAFQQTGTFAGTLRQWGLLLCLSALLVMFKQQLISVRTPWVDRGVR
jgi:Ca-activated chloride channel family protein